jgi:hypothetical protein
MTTAQTLQPLALSGDSVDVVQSSELQGSSQACNRNRRASVTPPAMVSPVPRQPVYRCRPEGGRRPPAGPALKDVEESLT